MQDSLLKMHYHSDLFANGEMPVRGIVAYGGARYRNKNTTNFNVATSVEERLASTLRFLASGAYS